MTIRRLHKLPASAARALLIASLTMWLVGAPLAASAGQVPPPPDSTARRNFETTALAAFAVDLTSGVELLNYNGDQQLPPASTMKIITALVVRSILDLDARTVVAPNEVLNAEEYSVMGLLPGDELAVRDLLYGLLIPSGGDAALVLARMGGQALDPQAADPVARFVAEMNTWALAHGLTNSHFVNPTGDDADGQVVTARDLVRGTQLLLADWFLAGIVRTPSANIQVFGVNQRVLELANTNQMLADPNVFGVKTGTDERALQCLVAGVWRGDNRIITVVLGSQDRYADTQAMLDTIDAQYRWLALGIGATSLGASDAIAAAGLTFRVRRTVLMSQEQAASAVWELVTETPAGVGGRAGYVQFTVGDREIALLPVYSSPAPS